MYAPAIPPVIDDEDLRTVLAYLYMELRDVASSLQAIGQGVFLVRLFAAPVKPVPGQLVFADGTTWNPGSGQGLYIYYGGAWHFAG